MEIPEIKARLTLSQVLKHYNIKPDKNLRINCPFHEDKNPSMQVYYKTHTAYCFSSNCRTHGKSIDVIDFILYMENFDTLGAEGKHKAMKKAVEILGGEARGTKPAFMHTPLSVVNTGQILERTQFLNNMFMYFKNAVHNSKPAKEYIKQRGLDYEKLEIGYNSGQFHHGTRKDETLIQNCLKVGLLLDYDRLSRTGEKAYQPFGKYCIVFALRNRANQVTGLYFRSTVNEDEAKHYYLKDRQGLYPHYPKADTERLILTEAIIDAVTLLQLRTTNEKLQEYELLTLFGTNGLSKEHIEAIKELKQLKEIIFAFDNDQAGRNATVKYGEELKELIPNIIFSKLELPENEDINSVYLAHQPEIFTHLIETRSHIFSFSNEKKEIETTSNVNQNIGIKAFQNFQINSFSNSLETINPKLETRNPDANGQDFQPETRNQEPGTRNPKPATRN